LMNRGINGEDIFPVDLDKNQFLDFLAETSQKMKIPVYAYCIMTNHYHLVLQNTNGKMWQLMRHLDGNYGSYYRKRYGGKGYVFQDRYRSTLIQDEAYLKISIAYLLLNPMRAGMTRKLEEYTWSSFGFYYNPQVLDCIVERKWVEELFGNKKDFIDFIYTQYKKELPLDNTKYGEILGSEGFLEDALLRYEHEKGYIGAYRDGIDEKYFEPVEKVLKEFESMKRIDIDDIDVDTYAGKRLRGELLVHLKDRTELTYREMIRFDLFSNLTCASLPPIYRNAKKRMTIKGNKD